VNLGDIVNSNSDNAVDDTITVTLVGRVADTVANVRGVVISGQASFTSATNAVARQSSAVTATIIEPLLTVAIADITPASTSIDAGDTRTLRATMAHTTPTSNGPALDNTIAVTMPTGFSYVPASVASSASCTVGTPTVTGSQVTFPIATFAAGAAPCQVTFQAALSPATVVDTMSTVSAALQYRSVPLPTTPENDQRVGTASSTTSISLASQAVSMTLTSSSLADSLTPGSSLAVGEEATFTVVIKVPEGTTRSGQLTVPFPLGAGSAGALRLLPGATVVPSSGVTIASSTPVLSDSFGSDTIMDTLTVNLGDIVNSNSDNAVDDTITVTLVGRVADTVANVRGVVISGQASFTSATNAVARQSSTVTATIIEPELSLVQTYSQPGPGQIDFRVTLAATAASNAPAQSIILQDRFPVSVYNPASIVVRTLPPGYTSSITTAMNGDRILTIQSDLAMGASPANAILPGASRLFEFSASLQPLVYGATSTVTARYNSLPETPPGTAVNGRLYPELTSTVNPFFVTVDTVTSDFAPLAVDIANYVPTSPPLDPATLRFSPIPLEAGHLTGSGTVITYHPLPFAGTPFTYTATICDTASPSRCHTIYVNVRPYYLRWVTPTAGTVWHMYFEQPIRWTSNLPADFRVYLEMTNLAGTVVASFPTTTQRLYSEYSWAPNRLLPGMYKLRIRTTTGSIAEFHDYQWPDSERVQLKPLKQVAMRPK